jgi:hypothetical protein
VFIVQYGNEFFFYRYEKSMIGKISVIAGKFFYGYDLDFLELIAEFFLEFTG